MKEKKELESGDGVRGWIRLVFNQWCLLMKKNVILTARRKNMAILQLISPLFFVAILFVIQLFVNQAMQTTPVAAEVVDSYGLAIPKIPHCVKPFNSDAKCYTIAYAPSTNITDLLVQRVALQSDLRVEDTIGFATPDEMDDYILQHPNTTQAGYVFLNYEDDFEYAIMYNQTNICMITVVQTCKSILDDVALPMSVAMDREIIRYSQEIRGTNVTSFSYEWSMGPLPQEKQEVYNASQWIGAIFFFAAVMFNFVILLRTMVLEKELRLKEGLKMMGLKEFSYWFSWFMYYNVVMLLCVLLLIASGYIFSIDLITKNSFGTYFFLLFLFAESMICFAFFLNSLIESSQLSSTVGFIFWIIMCAMVTPANQLLYTSDVPVEVMNALSMLSPLAFSKGISDLALEGAMGGLKWSDIDTYDTVFTVAKVYKYLLADCALYFILAWYISNVFPGNFGVPRPFYYFLVPSYWVGRKNTYSETQPLLHNRTTASNPDTAVILTNLQKVYKTGPFFKQHEFHAVKGISLSMRDNQLFCLLGPNGAGKTTTISMLTGLFPSSGGDAHIFGYSIINDMDKIRSLMGVCPQHDLLWDDMTGREHVEFFCKFKNVDSTEVANEVNTRLEEVGLTKIADIPTSAYSGGEKRRLSVALAMTGNPRIVFLDEPTTGMDPVARHQVWEIINSAKQGRVVILTTHSMEEADILSDKIAIVTNGELRCLGTNINLKTQYGVGYQLNLFFSRELDSVSHKRVVEFCKHEIPGVEIVSWSIAKMVLNVSREINDILPQVLRKLEENSTQLGIGEMTINLSSLEEVFLKIAGESENASIDKEDLENTKSGSVSRNSLTVISNNEDDVINAHKEATPFAVQFKALFTKICTSNIMEWKVLTFQFFLIPLLIVTVMYASGISPGYDIPENLHPFSFPPPYRPSQAPPPLSFPYLISSNIDIGECCTGPLTGFLGNVTLDVVTSTNPQAIGLGNLYHTSEFSFQKFDDKKSLDQFLYTNQKAGFLAAYEFNEMDFDGQQYLINLLRNYNEETPTIGYVNIISNAIFRLGTTRNSTLTVRLKQFPTQKHVYNPPPMNVEAAWGVSGSSFYMAIILSSIVAEKEFRQRYLMKMAGMRMSVYWLVLFLFHFLVYTAIVLFLNLMAFAIQLRFFNLNAPSVFIPAFILFAFSQVCMAFFLSTFCTSSHSASLGSYVWIVAMTLTGTYINPTWAAFGAPLSTLYSTAIIPHIAFGRIIGYVIVFFFPEGQGITWDDMTKIAPMENMYIFLVAQGVIFLLLHQYFELVLPSQYGVPLSPIFFGKKSFWRAVFGRKNEHIQHVEGIKMDVIHAGEPEDVAKERMLCQSPQHMPLCVNGVTKTFNGVAGKKDAVNNLAFTVRMGECFGLIGPNGGGKTTLLNVLSGLYPTTSGTASIYGFSITTHLTDAQRFIGVCPQDSILWNELTGYQHLVYFAKLRNLKGAELEKAVELALEQVMLTSAQHRAAGGYSGGMKRRLSLAIALIGNPMVVLLDEPTTGVDPFSKRVVWDVIHSYKQTRTIVLTTHSMEEAETLCDRVAIISEGKMKCIDKPVELKARYGARYNLSISHKGNSADIIKFVASIIADYRLVDNLSETCVFSLPKDAIKMSVLFEAIQKNLEDLEINDWGLHQSSLADVLIKVAGVGHISSASSSQNKHTSSMHITASTRPDSIM